MQVPIFSFFNRMMGHDISRGIRVVVFVEKEQMCFVVLEITFPAYSQEGTFFGKEGKFFQAGEFLKNS